MTRWLITFAVLGACGFKTPAGGPPADAEVPDIDAALDAPGPRCGDGIIAAPEECEPAGPTLNGCTGCRIDPGWICTAPGMCKKVTGMALSPREPLPSAGSSTGGGPFLEMCGPGRAIIGVEADSSNGDTDFGRLRAGCAAMTLGTDGHLAWGAIANTPYHATEQNGALGAIHCANDSVVVGYTANAGMYLSGLKLDCASVAVLHGALEIGAPVELAEYGPATRQDQAPADCAGGEVTAAYEGAAGSVLDHFDLKCFAVTLVAQ